MKAIAVLGSKVPGNEIHRELKLRLDTSFELFQNDSVFILSGGYTNSDSERSEASFMAEYLMDKGVSRKDIYLEEEALDTIGNGYFVRRVADGIKGLTKLYVVSSCYHMDRSEFIFRSCFGHRIELDFKHCSVFVRDDTAEEDSMKLARKFFSGLADGDIDSVGRRLYSDHVLYAGKDD